MILKDPPTWLPMVRLYRVSCLIYKNDGVVYAFPPENLMFLSAEAEFKEFERRLKFKPRLKYSWFHLKLY